MDEEKAVNTNMGMMPIEDYLENMAFYYGYNSYEELKADNMTLEEKR